MFVQSNPKWVASQAEQFPVPLGPLHGPAEQVPCVVLQVIAVPQVGPRNPATQVEHAPLPFVPLQVAGSQVPWLMSQVMAVQVEPK